VGRLSPEKGVHVLIEAFKRLGERWPTLELHLVGAESLLPYIYLYPSRDPVSASVEVYYGSNFRDIVRRQLITRGNGYLRSLVATASGDQRIVFHGEVPHTAIINFYRSATILVVPSVCNEAFGIPAIEAAACGVPVIATRSGGLPEVILHGRTGLVVSRQNAEALSGAIDELLSAPGRASAMGRAGRERVLSCFSWDNSARRLVDLIESVARSRSTSSGSSSARTCMEISVSS
jgi:glycosyltransferase involved in cell wall biosynthesis